MKVKYTTFKTCWGYFGIAGDDTGLLVAALPEKNPERAENAVFKKLNKLNIPDMKLIKADFPLLKEQIRDYFEGINGKFTFKISKNLLLTPFQKAVLKTCMKIRCSKTASYKQLCKRAGYPGASRAAGSVMAKNKLALLIPCHRVVNSGGKLGKYSAPGGTKTKAKLLNHEKYLKF